MKTDSGILRRVFIFQNFVIKIPTFKYEWKYFLQELIANINEREIWKTYQRKELLCPVIFSIRSGLILIMKKAEALTEEQYKKINL